MSFSQIASILRARWWVALLVLILTVGATAAISLVMPKTYTATASVVVDVKADPIAGIAMAGLMMPSYIPTQVDVIKSDRVAQRVVRNLKLTEGPEVRAQWEKSTQGRGNMEQWLMDGLQQKLEVKPSRESNVINVSFKAGDPTFAATLANAFVKAYLDTTIELRTNPARQYTQFFDTRAKELREAFEKAQAKLSDFQREKGIISVDDRLDRLDVEMARLNEISSQLVQVQSAAAESTSRQSQAAGGAGDRMQEVLNNPVIAGLKSDLGRSEARLQELNSRLGDNHPQVIEARANIRELRARLDAETRRVTGGVAVSNTINRAREAQLRADLEAQRTKVLHMKQVRDEGSVLARDVENAQRAYEAVLNRMNQTSLEGQNNLSNITWLTQAMPPTDITSPKLVQNTMLSVVVGLVLAIGSVLAIELVDRRVRAIEDVSSALGLPLLGVLPKPLNRSHFGTHRLPLMQQRLLSSPVATTNRET